MKISVALPTTGPTASPQSIAETARQAEAANLHRLWTVDRLLRPADGTAYVDEHYKCAFDPIETLAWVAARTSKIGLGTSIVLLPFQNPVVLARRLATLDHLSDGRALIGLGLGHMPQEFEVAGVPELNVGRALRKASPRCAQPGDPIRSSSVGTSRIFRLLTSDQSHCVPAASLSSSAASPTSQFGGPGDSESASTRSSKSDPRCAA